MKFNINDDVKVKLTQFGWDVHKAHWLPYCDSLEEYERHMKPKVDKNGYTKFQLWDLMRIFGETMYNGNMNKPFDMEIII